MSHMCHSIRRRSRNQDTATYDLKTWELYEINAVNSVSGLSCYSTRGLNSFANTLMQYFIFNMHTGTRGSPPKHERGGEALKGTDTPLNSRHAQLDQRVRAALLWTPRIFFSIVSNAISSAFEEIYICCLHSGISGLGFLVFVYRDYLMCTSWIRLSIWLVSDDVLSPSPRVVSS